MDLNALRALCQRRNLDCDGLDESEIRVMLRELGILRPKVVVKAKNGKVKKGKAKAKKAVAKKKLPATIANSIDELIETYATGSASIKLNIKSKLEKLSITYSLTLHDEYATIKEILATNIPSIAMYIPNLRDRVKHFESSSLSDQKLIATDLLYDLENKLDNFDWSLDKPFELKVIKLRDRLMTIEDETDGSDEVEEIDLIEYEKTLDRLKEIESPSSPSIPTLEKKPSIVQRMGFVRSQYTALTTFGSDRARDRARVQLIALLDKYNWDDAPQFRKDVEDVVNKKQTPPEAVKPAINKPVIVEKRPVKIRTQYKPGVYAKTDVSFKLAKKDEIGSAFSIDIPRPKLTITLEQLRTKIKNADFVRQFANSSRELMVAKEKVYTLRLLEMQKQYDMLRVKVIKLKHAGIDDHVIEKTYPEYITMSVYIIDLETIVQLVRDKAQTITDEAIAEGLEDAIEDEDDGIAALMGRTDIKDQLATQIYSFSKGYKTFFNNFNNIVITGVAGTGKTRLARTIAFAFSRIGILARDVVKIVTRVELVGQYIGHTAPRTRGIMTSTLEGVLFIDEAPELTKCPEERGGKDFGSEAVTEMINFMDKYIGLSITIVAGYKDLMHRCFMTFNEGLPRRFPFVYDLQPYSVSELSDILITNLKRRVRDDVTIDDATGNFLYSVIEQINTHTPDVLSNQAGDMLNLSSSINKSINSTYTIEWVNGNLPNNIPILMDGVHDFLSVKGYILRDG